MNEASTQPADEGVWDRLRRRKVVQWSVAYVAAAWALLQGLQFLADLYGWPLQVLRLITLGLALGLPMVLVLAWYHGDRGEQRIRGTEVAIISLLFLLGGGIFWLYDRNREDDAEGVTAQGAAPVASTEVAAPAPDAKSIAVLPFADMSPAKDQEYMSDGIAEELLNLLAQVPDLKVIARTSSFAFKGQNVEIAEIAKRLNVAHVLEGSVRKSGNTVRITAQLIRTSDSTHLWSERYDRPLDDIFAVQDEIANAIGQALQIHLMGGPLTRQKGGTQNLEAYQLYLRAVNARNQNTQSSLDAAGDYLEQAVRLDPNYGRAWSELATTVALKTESGYLPTTEGYERMRQLAQQALQLSPDLAGAHAHLQNYYLAVWDWEAAASEGKQALAIDPTDSGALMVNAMLSFTFGHWDDAESQLHTALTRDPLDPFLAVNLARVYYGAGRFEESEAMYRHALELAPGYLGARAYLGKTLLAAGKPAAALAMVQQEVDEGNRLLYLPVMLQAVGRNADADEALRALIAKWGDTNAFHVAQNYAYRGDHDRALEWLDRAYEQQDLWLFEILGEHLFKDMADDPRFKAFLRKMKLPEWPRPPNAAAGT